jgi:ethylmalonyl-CoA mutase
VTERSKPWLMRTYSGHSTAAESNALYRTNLAQGQTGLSVAFDLPTQTGYDPDAPQARGEVGRVGVPVAHLGHLEALFEAIPLEKMNTSMTINATAPWLLGLYLALADRRGLDRRVLQGTVQNDLVKEFLSRGTYIFPPAASKHLVVDTVVYAVREVRAGTRSTSAATTSKRPARRPSRRSPTHSRRPSTCSTPSARRAPSRTKRSLTSSRASASS